MTIEQNIDLGIITEQNYEDYLGLGEYNDNTLYKNFNPEEVVELEPEPKPLNIFQVENEYLNGMRRSFANHTWGGYRPRGEYCLGVKVLLTNGEVLYFTSVNEFATYLGRSPSTAYDYLALRYNPSKAYAKLGIVSAERSKRV